MALTHFSKSLSGAQLWFEVVDLCMQESAGHLHLAALSLASCKTPTSLCTATSSQMAPRSTQGDKPEIQESSYSNTACCPQTQPNTEILPLSKYHTLAPRGLALNPNISHLVCWSPLLLDQIYLLHSSITHSQSERSQNSPLTLSPASLHEVKVTSTQGPSSPAPDHLASRLHKASTAGSCFSCRSTNHAIPSLC